MSAACITSTSTGRRPKRFAAESLAPYEVPTEIHVVDQIPRTDSGKVDLAAVAVVAGT